MRRSTETTPPRTHSLATPLLAVLVLAIGCGQGPVDPTPTVPPSLTCPASISISGVVGGMQSVTYTTPAATGGAAPVTTMCAPSSGASFQTGATTVNCTAIDAQNRQATCSFSVTLQPLLLNIHRFVAFGDSVTAGEDGRRLQLRPGFIDPVKAYPAVLQTMMMVDFPDQGVFVANEGHGGVRATDDVRNLAGIMQTYRAEALLLLHGYNDLLNDGLRAVDPVAFSLRDDIRIARAQGVQHVFLSTITPSRPASGRFNRTIDPRAIQETNARLVQIASRERAVLVNTFDAFRGRELELVEEDGLHPTVMGSQVIAETFYAAIRAAGVTSGFRQLPTANFQLPKR